MLGVLTAIIGVVAKGKASKAIAGAILPAVAGAFVGPEVLGSFQSGVGEGLTPAAYSLGVALGGVVAGGINYAVTWLAPKNDG